MKSKKKVNNNEMKNTDRIFLGACFGMPLGVVGMATGSLFAFIFNIIVGSDTDGKKFKRAKRKSK